MEVLEDRLQLGLDAPGTYGKHYYQGATHLKAFDLLQIQVGCVNVLV